MFRVGINPYGMCCAVGLQGAGTHRGAPKPLGLAGFLRFAEAVEAHCVELDFRLIETLDCEHLEALGSSLTSRNCEPIISAGPPAEHMPRAIEVAEALGAKLVRMSLTNVLCGDRNAYAERWDGFIADSREALKTYAPAAREKGIDFAIENHQDLCGEEILHFADEAGPNVGICLDTGNALAVGEDVIAFAERVAGRVRHVHFKDYRAQFTDEGYRLVRCPIGDGCVPFEEIAEILRPHHPRLTASMEPGALEARHVRLFTQDWWNGYPSRSASELGAVIGTARRNRIPDLDDWRTPWERNRPGAEIVAFEMAEERKSFDNVKAWGWH